MSNECELIRRICRRLPSGSARSGVLRLGVGDDAAVLRPSPGTEWVWTCDALLENVHFLALLHPPRAVGFKALARATSDLAAMGAVPRFFLLGLALPSDRTGAWLDGFLAGMARVARKCGLVLAGGDTAQQSAVAVYVSMLGQVPSGGAVTRSGARPGDLLYVTGRLGAAQLGLELLLRGIHRERSWQPLLRPHLYPPLRLGVGQWVGRRRLASAMIDTSDGLSSDLQRLCQSSGVGARLWAEQIPRVRVPPALRERGLDALELALHGGEDYELLFSVPRHLAKEIPGRHHGVPITPLGEIVRGRAIVLVGRNGHSTPLVPRGWDHFGSPRGR